MSIVCNGIELILHIGTGKTGTSSIQNYLGKIQRETDSVLYAGYMFELLQNKRFPWQRVAGTQEFNDTPKEQLKRDLELVLTDAVDAARRAGASRIIWSNEALCNMSWLPIMISQLWQGEITTICFVREPASYSVSAYFQWGIKHKIYHGEIPSYSEFTQKHHFVHASIIESWKSISSTFWIFNYDKSENVIATFCEHLGLPLRPGLSQQRVNKTVSVAQLYASALANSSQQEPCLFQLPTEWESMANKDENWFCSKLPTVEQIESHLAKTQCETDKLNQLLAECGGESTELETGNITELLIDDAEIGDVTKVLAQHTVSLTIKHHAEIQRLNSHLSQQAQQYKLLEEELATSKKQQQEAVLALQHELRQLARQRSVKTMYRNMRTRLLRLAKAH